MKFKTQEQRDAERAASLAQDEKISAWMKARRDANNRRVKAEKLLEKFGKRK